MNYILAGSALCLAVAAGLSFRLARQLRGDVRDLWHLCRQTARDRDHNLVIAQRLAAMARAGVNEEALNEQLAALRPARPLHRAGG